MYLKKESKYSNVKLLDCSIVAENVERLTKQMITELDKKPRLLIATVGHDPASEVYVGKKIQMGKKLGIVVQHIKLGGEITTEELHSHLNEWNDNKDIHGIIVQLPVPEHICMDMIRSTISPVKDVDGLTYANAGRLDSGTAYHEPCTPAGIMEIFGQNGIKLANKKVVIFGRSDIVGKPMQKMLLNANAAVTVLHSRIDRDKQIAISQEADIIIVAIGKPWFLQPCHVKKGAVIIDVGINRVECQASGRNYLKKSLVGDADLETIGKWVDNVTATPVPGGVGPMTVQMLMRNVVNAVLIKEGKL